MANIETLPNFGKKTSSRYGHTFGLDRQERIARESLRDMLAFHALLEKEMKRMLAANSKESPIDSELFDRMVSVKDKFGDVMQGYKVNDDARQRHVLMIYADTVQDLMAYIHKHRRH